MTDTNQQAKKSEGSRNGRVGQHVSYPSIVRSVSTRVRVSTTPQTQVIKTRREQNHVVRFFHVVPVQFQRVVVFELTRHDMVDLELALETEACSTLAQDRFGVPRRRAGVVPHTHPVV